jgi:putative oxidoreductase
MKIASLIGRILLGLLLLVFGLNGFLNFMPTPPMPTDLAGQFAGALVQSHYMSVIFALDLIAGILLLLNRYVPLALTLIAPVIVNIVFFHAFMAPRGLPIAFFMCVLWILSAIKVWPAFAALLEQRVQTDAKLV